MKNNIVDVAVANQPQRISYAQSANTLFNFMEYCDYLQQTLFRKALIPRYYVEKVSYLDLEVEGELYDEIGYA